MTATFRSACIGVAAIVLGFLAGGGVSCMHCPKKFHTRYVGDNLNRPDTWVDDTAVLEIDAKTIVITYETTDGSKWTVQCERTS